MATTVIDAVREHLPADLVDGLSRLVREPADGVRHAIEVGIPVVLAGMLQRSGQVGGPERLVHLGGDNPIDAGALADLTAVMSGGAATERVLVAGQRILLDLFGGNTNALVTAIATVSGLRGAAVHTLLDILAPLALAVLSKTQQGNGGAMAAALRAMRPALVTALPASIAHALTAVLGVTNLGMVGGGPGAAYRESGRRVGGDGVARWLVPVALLVAVAGGVRYCAVGDRLPDASSGGGPATTLAVVATTTASITLPTTTTTTVAPTSTTLPGPPKRVDLTLPGGTKLRLLERTIAFDLAQFLADPAATALPRTFVFDHLDFASGSTRLTGESWKTLADLTAILKAHGAAEIRLEGHTDDVGDAAANKALSQRRADTVLDVLRQGGIASARMTTAGFGSEKPVVPNDTAEGRAQNRRLELVVVKK